MLNSQNGSQTLWFYKFQSDENPNSEKQVNDLSEKYNHVSGNLFSTPHPIC